MSVVGIDLGYQSCFVSIARHGGVETITNEYSERSSPSLVGFCSNQRTMGTTAKTQSIANFKNTIAGFKTLIGRKFSDPIAQDEIKKQHYQVEHLPGDQIGIKVQYLGEESVLTPTQVMASMLTYLKGISENALAKPVADCVIAVPSYFTDAQRRALLDASVISGLNCLRLLNETTAIALAYGIYKQDLPDEKDKSRNVVFVDMGHHSLQVTICAFNKGKLKVLSKAFDPMLGGRDFDRRLLLHFANEFKDKYKMDILSRGRQTIRLTNECEKLKKLMSANATSIPLNIECFMDDKDVSGRFKRDDFEALCKDLLARVKKPLETALHKSGLKLDEIHSVEIVGGSTRIPIIKEIISNVFQRELSTTLNLDEAVARGCALQCAILSPTFKVRDFVIQDTQLYPIKLTWDNNGEPGEMVVFSEGDPIYHSKVLTFYRKDKFDLCAIYKHPDQIYYSDPFVGKFQIQGVKPTDENESSKVKVKVRMSTHGTFFIKSATMIEKQIPVDEPVVEKMETEVNQNQSESDCNNQSGTDNQNPGSDNQNPVSDNQNSGSDNQNPVSDNQNPGSDNQNLPDSGVNNSDPSQDISDTDTQTVDSTSQQEGTDARTKHEQNGDKMETETNEDTNKTQTQTNENGTQSETKNGTQTGAVGSNTDTKKPKKTYKHIDLPIDEQTYSLKKKYLDDAFERECKMTHQDRMEAEKIDAKNSVEEYVYDMRDKISTSLTEFISDEANQSFISLLDATEEWLYDEGEDQPKKVYAERLKELKSHGDPVVERQKEHTHRDSAFDLLARTIVHYEKILSEYVAEDEKYNHIPSSDMDKVKEALQVKRDWMTNQMQAQSTTPLHVDPVVKVTEIHAATKNLNSTCNPIVTKPKPKVEPPKDTNPDNGEKKEEEVEQTTPPGGEEKMEEDEKTTTTVEEEMDIDVD